MSFYRKTLRFVVFVLLLSMASCIELLNVVNINADKSGMAFIGLQVSAIGSLISLSGENLDEETKNSMLTFPSQAASQLSTISGIHNIKTYTKMAQGKIGVEFDFDNAKALNKAYYKLLGKDRKWYFPNLIRINNHKVKTRNITPYIKHYFDSNESMLIETDLLKYMKYTTVISAPEPIKEGSFKRGDLSNNKKDLKYSIPMKNILNESTSTASRFKY